VIYRRVLGNSLPYYAPDFSRDERKLRARVCDCDRESNGTYFPELIHRNRAAIDSANIPLLSPPFSMMSYIRSIRRDQHATKLEMVFNDISREWK